MSDELKSRRLLLQSKLKTILGSEHVYFQPPKSIMLTYPCIVYSRSPQSVRWANNKPYTIHQRYTLTYITKDPDDPLITTILEAFGEMIRPDRFFVSDNLYHNNFNLFF